MYDPRVEVVRIKGDCPVCKVGDRFLILEG